MDIFLERTMVPVGPLAFWFALFCVKHVLADFLWQPHWMAIGKEQASGWLRPLVLHCLIHGACTTVLLIFLQPRLWILGLADFAIHLVIDRCKGRILSRYGLTASDRPFWTLLGVDQTLHHLTGFALTLLIVTHIP